MPRRHYDDPITDPDEIERVIAAWVAHNNLERDREKRVAWANATLERAKVDALAKPNATAIERKVGIQSDETAYARNILCREAEFRERQAASGKKGGTTPRRLTPDQKSLGDWISEYIEEHPTHRPNRIADAYVTALSAEENEPSGNPLLPKRSKRAVTDFIAKYKLK